jgi:hypothetical protein
MIKIAGFIINLCENFYRNINRIKYDLILLNLLLKNTIYNYEKYNSNIIYSPLYKLMPTH